LHFQVGCADGHVSPKRLSLRPDDKPMTADDIRELHDEIASSDNIELQWLCCMTAVQIEWWSSACW